MPTKRSFPGPVTILMCIIILAAAATWLIPAGEYNKLSVSGDLFQVTTEKGDIKLPLSQPILDSLDIQVPLEKFREGLIRKPISVPGTYHYLPRNGQGLISILQAPIKGIYDTIDIILFILVIGGFMSVFHESGAMVKGLASLSNRMKGRESWLIIILTFLFSFAGSSYGMAEEAIVFYPVLVPLFLKAGYDLLVPVAVIFGGTQLGTLSSFSNPFSVIVASNAAGVSWLDGFYERIGIFVVSTAVFIGYLLYYARKIKKDPSASIVFKTDGHVKSPYESIVSDDTKVPRLDTRSKLLLILFLCTFLTMIMGVLLLEWWLTEMTALFLGAAILVAFLLGMKEKIFVKQFIKGGEELLTVAFIVGVARGITIVLNEGHISDSILFFASKLITGLPAIVFILILFVLYFFFTLFISSSSGMAVLTMPIIGALAIFANVPGREVVNTYLYGMGIMGFITPAGLILPSLALVNISLKAWLRFLYPLLILLAIVCALFLVAGVLL
jgi:uncharacterized ion transporter superfamily protein YfcC